MGYNQEGELLRAKVRVVSQACVAPESQTLLQQTATAHGCDPVVFKIRFSRRLITMWEATLLRQKQAGAAHAGFSPPPVWVFDQHLGKKLMESSNKGGLAKKIHPGLASVRPLELKLWANQEGQLLLKKHQN